MQIHTNVLAAFGLVLAVSPVSAQQVQHKHTKAELAQADLWMAMISGKLASVKAALDGGADPNKPEAIELTPLAFARDIPTVKLLLSRGAKINGGTIRGSALTNALLVGNEPVATFLLDHGAKPNNSRVDGISSLIAAAASGSTKSLERLLKLDKAVDASNMDGATALSFAARNNKPGSVKLLLANRAKVDSKDNMKRTPLHYAALYGYANMAKDLIAHGASVKSVDITGATPLHLAAHYSGDADTIKNLIAAGASKSAKDGRGKTPFELATKRGYDTAAILLANTSSGSVINASYVEPRTAAEAIKPAIAAIQTSMKTYSIKAPGCTSCHHQGLGTYTLGMASQHQLQVDRPLYNTYVKMLATDLKAGLAPASVIHAAVLDPKMKKMIPGIELGDFSYMFAYFGAARTAAGVPSSRELGDIAMFVAREQGPDGSWSGGSRGTMQHSDVTNTYMVMQMMRAYFPVDKKAEMDSRFAKAVAWASSFKPKCDEDIAGKVLVLKVGGADVRTVAAATENLIAAQRKDGGWGIPTATISDAYTTGLSLFALRTASGLTKSNQNVSRAVDFLIRTQDEDGTWFVQKVTPAFNNHFDTSFPHGYDQYASFAGTCWATIGLMESVDTHTASR